MFTLVTSGTNIEEIFRRVNELMKELDYNSSNTDMVSQQIRDLFVMMFHKRQMREGGEGQKMVFYSMMLAIYDYYPNTICDIIKGKLIPHHGYYKDYFNLLEGSNS